MISSIPLPRYFSINDDATHELEIDGADTAIEYYTLSDNRNSQVGFTTHFDKDLSEISLQIRFENTGSDEVVAGVTADVSDTGNEFVIYTMFVLRSISEAKYLLTISGNLFSRFSGG